MTSWCFSGHIFCTDISATGFVSAVMILVDPGLYIGTAANLNDHQELVGANISHILSVDSVDPSPLFPDDRAFVRKWIDVLDEETSDLLSYMDTSFRFIKEAVDGGRAALVHW